MKEVLLSLVCLLFTAVLIYVLTLLGTASVYNTVSVCFILGGYTATILYCGKVLGDLSRLD